MMYNDYTPAPYSKGTLRLPYREAIHDITTVPRMSTIHTEEHILQDCHDPLRSSSHRKNIFALIGVVFLVVFTLYALAIAGVLLTKFFLTSLK